MSERRVVTRRAAARRIAERRRSMLCMVLAGVLTIAFIFIFLCNHIVSANESEPSYKYYTSIQIAEGDSLWVIADEYRTPQYHDNQEYIQEVVQLNHLKDETIHAGQHLTIPYYSSQVLQ